MKHIRNLLIFSLIFLLGFSATAKGSIDEQYLKLASIDKNKKIIYLTFDDGPSSTVTNDILDVLKEQNVKATFFVIGNRIKGKEVVIRRMFNEGHSIGLHTYSHKYDQIYANENAFISEMIKTSKEIGKVIGIEPTIIRFPYGSNNHLNNAFLKKLHAHHFKIYDWNASISDGIRPNTPPDAFVREAIATGNGIPYIIFLMHNNSSNKNTYLALTQIIHYYRNLGYEFRPITSDTPEFYWHPLK